MERIQGKQPGQSVHTGRMEGLRIMGAQRQYGKEVENKSQRVVVVVVVVGAVIVVVIIMSCCFCMNNLLSYFSLFSTYKNHFILSSSIEIFFIFQAMDQSLIPTWLVLTWSLSTPG